MLNLLGLFALILPASLAIDYLIKKRVDANPAKTYDYNGRISDTFLMFMPFSVLFFTDEFWMNIVYLVLYFGYAYVVIYIAYQKKWSAVGPEMLVITFPGSMMLVIVGYYIFFHDGVLAPQMTQSSLSESVLAAQPAQPEVVEVIAKSSIQQAWPYAVYALFLLSQLVIGLIERSKRIEAGKSIAMLFLQILGFTVLPMFTEYYWWLMLAGLVLFVMITQSVVKRAELTARGGIGFVLLYAYMMAAVASIAVYGFLF